jgi:hypothetical protein
MLKNIPWVSLVGAIWAVIRLKWWGLDIVLGYHTSFGVVLLFLALGALVAEFWKSVDIREGNFFWDLTFALATLGGGVYTITILDQRAVWDILDILIFLVLVVDAWVSPYLAFRTALRNVVHSSY